MRRAIFLYIQFAMRYAWDENKRLSNIEKHGVDFVSAVDFEWRASLVRASHSGAAEPRLMAMAPIRTRIHVLVFSIETRCVRIISLRKANAREVIIYGSQK
ncbi:BrnT family toxin [Gluconacetobacter dulcium]|uniref:BrnT family toxin n=1 Tax=Gluconacetobacter dulcium TaxID=2729096 RepID=UPI001FE559A4|nr:BrnT family toxin [Gluconacetobacter dulcium]